MTFNNLSLFAMLALAVCLSIWTPSVQANDIYQQAMVRLDRTEAKGNVVENLTQFRNKPMVMSFFMPNCKWCKKQHKSLKNIQKTCPNAQVVMLGVQGNYQQLKKELHKDRNQFPAYMANKEIVQAIGSKSPVPFTLVFDSQGRLAFKTTGYMPQAKLTALMLEKNIDICHST